MCIFTHLHARRTVSCRSPPYPVVYAHAFAFLSYARHTAARARSHTNTREGCCCGAILLENRASKWVCGQWDLSMIHSIYLNASGVGWIVARSIWSVGRRIQRLPGLVGVLSNRVEIINDRLEEVLFFVHLFTFRVA